MRTRLALAAAALAVLTAVLTSCTEEAPRAPGTEPPVTSPAAAPTTTSRPPTPSPTPSPTPRDLPASMAALGDSMTRAFLVCENIGDCPEASWATGSFDDIDSHARRVSAFRKRPIAAQNLAVSGARVGGLASQVDDAIGIRPEYVTILIGANDACRPSEESMTPVADYAAEFDRALGTLVGALPKTRVLVVSIPDLLRLWEIGKDVERVRRLWERYGVCGSMLGDPTATSPAANERRARVRQRVVDYNAAMAKACARHKTCRWDGNAVFDYRFTLEEVSSRDYWHPSREGQRSLSRVAWEAGFWA